MSEALTDTTAQTTEAASPTETVVVSGAQDAAPVAEQGGTLLGSDPVEKPVVAPADWPEDWRAKVAGEDAKELARLQRMGSPADVWKAYRALEAKISSGQLKQGLKPDATPEEIKTWRAENGLPESPEGYKPQLPNGMIPGEEDAPLIDWFKKAAHAHNVAPDQFNGILGDYFAYQDEMRAQAFEADKTFRSTAEDQLRAEWGPQYRPEIKGISNYINATGPEGLADLLFNARSADGKMLGDHPVILQWLSSRARAENPMATLVPAGSADPMKAGEARIQEIEGIMKTDQRRYWNDAEMQQEYSRLLEAKSSMTGRAA
jgi:hypothetical protein